jgi:hypothetical protein
MKDLFNIQMPKIKAIKIDVDTQSIYEIEIDANLDSYYKAIGNDCRLIEVGARMPHGNPLLQFKDVMYVDEEALLKWNSMEEQNKIGYFKLAIPPSYVPVENRRVDMGIIHKFVGSAIIVGTDNDGETISHNQTIRKVHERVMGFHKEK